MKAPLPRRRPAAEATSRKAVKCTISVPVELHALWCAESATRQVTRNTLIVESLRNTLRGCVFYRRSEGDGGAGPDAPVAADTGGRAA